MRTCVNDNGLDAEGVFDNQAPICVRKSFGLISINLQCPVELSII